MGGDELLRLDEHAARAAAGVVDAALVRFNHLDEQLHDRAGRVELASSLALLGGELAEEVLVDAAEHVLGTVARAEAVADQVDQLAEPLLIERRPRVLLRQDARERTVLAFDRVHGRVDERSDLGLLCTLQEK